MFGDNFLTLLMRYGRHFAVLLLTPSVRHCITELAIEHLLVPVIVQLIHVVQRGRHHVKF